MFPTKKSQLIENLINFSVKELSNYSKKRNYDLGPPHKNVSKLSPYLRTRFISEEEVLNLRKLFLEVYKKEFTKDELHWRYIKNPLNKGKIYNCISLLDEEIVGHTAIMKHEFYYNNKIYYGGLTSGSTVSNKVTGIFPNLYFFLEDNCKSDFDFLYGLPNKNSSPFFLKLFGLRPIKYAGNTITNHCLIF